MDSRSAIGVAEDLDARVALASASMARRMNDFLASSDRLGADGLP